MSISLADKIFLTAGLLDFGGIFIWMGVNLHMAYTKMDEMLRHLKNSPLITTFFLRSNRSMGETHPSRQHLRGNYISKLSYEAWRH